MQRSPAGAAKIAMFMWLAASAVIAQVKTGAPPAPGVDTLICPDTVSVGVPVTVQCRIASPPSPILDYAWDFDGDNAIDTTTTVLSGTTTYKHEGLYTITCHVRDQKGGTALKTRVIAVVNAPATVHAGGPYQVRVNSPLIMNGSASDPDSRIVAYSWDFDGDGRYDWSSSSSAGAKYTFTRPGKQTVRFKVTTDDGKSFHDSAVVDVVNDPPVAYAGEDVVLTKPGKVLLKGSGRDRDDRIVKYEWDFDGDGKYDWSSADTGYTEARFTSFSRAVLRVTDAYGATATDTVRIVICPDDMTPVKDGKFCIDTYEWPNVEGSVPAVNVGYDEAAAECAKAGKRLCSGAEWRQACGGGGKQPRPYPYGAAFGSEKCNTLGNSWSVNKVMRSGALSACRSAHGVEDMSGNVAEWTAETGGNGRAAYGGSWQGGEKDSRCDSRVFLSTSLKYFYVGFRCCE